jgi:hypothetical protein
MTGPSDGLDEEGTDPLESLLRHPVGILPPPPGSFDRIRRTAARRRVLRAAAGGGLAVAAVVGSLYIAGTLHLPEGRHTPQATSPPPPSLSRPPASGSAAPSPTEAPTVVGIQPTAPAPGASAGSSAGSAVPALPSPSATTSAAAPMCATSQLSAALGDGNAGAGQVYRYLVIINSSRTTCHLTGFPGLSLLDASGRQIGAAATYDHLGYTPVVLAPGASASDTIHTVNRQTSNPGECLATSTSLRIYPPGNRDALVIPGAVTNCDNTLTVTPLTSGSTGNPPS